MKLPALVPLFLAAYAAFGQTPRIHNFGEVEPGWIYRGAQPGPNGFADLKRAGVKTVLDLRDDGTVRSERKAIEALGIRFVSVPLNGFHAPTDRQIAAAMKALETSSRPIFVHCRFGEDRTGTVIACWRIHHDGWPNTRALREAESYRMHHFERGMKGYIRRYR